MMIRPGMKLIEPAFNAVAVVSHWSLTALGLWLLVAIFNLDFVHFVTHIALVLPERCEAGHLWHEPDEVHRPGANWA
jgi:hypothetical protein